MWASSFSQPKIFAAGGNINGTLKNFIKFFTILFSEEYLFDMK